MKVKVKNTFCEVGVGRVMPGDFIDVSSDRMKKLVRQGFVEPINEKPISKAIEAPEEKRVETFESEAVEHIENESFFVPKKRGRKKKNKE